MSYPNQEAFSKKLKDFIVSARICIREIKKDVGKLEPFQGAHSEAPDTFSPELNILC